MVVKQPEQALPPAPAGTFSAVCVDEIDLGVITSTYNGEERTRHMVRLVWQIDEDNPDAGLRYLVRQDYTASLDEKAKLRKHLETWRGRPFTEIERAGFDLENIVGAPCLLSIVHNAGRKGGTFANVASVMKLPRNMPAIVPDRYVRLKDRPVAAAAPKPSAPPPEPPPQNWGPADEDVPFS